MTLAKLVAIAGFSLVCAACGTSPTKKADAPPAAAGNAGAPGSTTKTVKSRDGSFTGEIVGTPVAGSKFAKLQIGMDMSEIQDILGHAPDRSHSYESGKRWIPFYFGNDARRLQAYYKGEGCLIITNGNIWGGSGGDLIQIEFDPSGACYQP